MKIPKITGLKIENSVSALKRMALNGLCSVKNAFERTPASDVFVNSIHFSKSGISEPEQKYISQINNVPVLGVGKTELPILRLVQESMFNMLKLTEGKTAPYTEILFAHDKNPQKFASVYYPSNALFVNKTCLENIDQLINTNTKVFDIVKWITKDKDGKYRIIDLLRNPQSEKYEKLLNEYTPEWSLREKFELDLYGTYYRNLATGAFYNPKATIEKIFSNEDNCRILKEKGLYEKRKEISPLKSFQEDYMLEIGKYCHLPEDTCLNVYPEIVFNHEYIHKWCFDNFSEDYLKELHSEPVIKSWANDNQIKATANKVSLNAAEDPMEYIAEVGAGLAGGQKFDRDVMSLYESLKGPEL